MITDTLSVSTPKRLFPKINDRSQTSNILPVFKLYIQSVAFGGGGVLASSAQCHVDCMRCVHIAVCSCRLPIITAIKYSTVGISCSTIYLPTVLLTGISFFFQVGAIRNNAALVHGLW